METQNIQVTVNEEDIVFTIELAQYNQFVSDLATRKNKVSAFRNFLMTVVAKDSKSTLEKYIDLPSIPLSIGGVLIEAYIPEISVTLGKSTTASTT